MLSGTDELKEMLNQDQHLGRRIKPTVLRSIGKATEANMIRGIINAYTAEIDLHGFTEIDPKFIDRFLSLAAIGLGVRSNLSSVPFSKQVWPTCSN